MSVDPVSLAITAAFTAASIAMTASQKIEGPRLKETDVNTSEYGTPLSYFHGTRRFDGCPCIWAEPLREEEVETKTKGGKYTNYKYYGTWAVAIADHEIDAVTRIWFDRHLIYDVTGTGPIAPILPPTPDLSDGVDERDVIIGFFFKSVGENVTIYTGTETQEPDPRIQATVDAEHGEGSTPAYRGVSYIVFKDIPLEHVGNRIPQVSVEATRNATPTLPFENIDIEPATSGENISISDGVAFTVGVSGWSAIDLVTHEVIGTGTNASGSFTTAPVGGQPSFYVVGPGPSLQVVDPLAGMVTTVHTSSTTGNALYVNEAYEWITQLGDGLVLMTRTSGLAYDSFGDSGGVTTNSFDFDADPATNIAPVYGFLRDYDTGVVWGLFVGDTGQMIPAAIGAYPLKTTAGVADPWSGFTPTTYFGKGLSSGKWLIAGKSGAGTKLALYDPATGTFGATADAGGIAAELSSVIASISPEATRAWIGLTEFNLTDLTVLRTVALPPGALGSQYDPINHALVGESAAGDFGWTFLDRVSPGGVTLQTVFDDVTTRVGLVPGVDTDSAALADIEVRGYSWTQGQAKAIVEPLFELHDFDLRPHDFVLQALARGGAPVGTITTAYMGAGSPGAEAPRYEVVQTLDTDLPASVSLSFADIAAQQQPNTALAVRPSVATDGRREVSIDLSTLVLTADEARPLTDRVLRRRWIGAETVRTRLGRRHIGLEPGDVWLLDLDGTARRARLTRLEPAANGVLRTEWERDGAAAATLNTLPGAPSDGFEPQQIPAPGLSRGFVMDIPLISDVHDETTPQLYVAAGPLSGSSYWPGAAIYQSADGGLTYATVLATRSSRQRATWGTTTDVLADASPTIWDRGNSVNVALGAGTLTSTTEAALNASPTTNLALIGDELIQFTTATLEGDGTYTLSGLKRGRRGTEWATGTHAAGESFVLLNSAVGRAAMGVSDVGQTEYFKTLTTGRSSGPVTSFAYTGATLKPYAPAHVEAVRDDATGDWTITWVRRTRIGGAWVGSTIIPLGEGSEAYEVVILDGATVKRVISTATQTATYTAAQQTADFGAPQLSFDLKVYQLSATVGRGFAAELSV